MSSMSYDIGVTRFDNKTWAENISWRERFQWQGCVYCCRVPIRESIPQQTRIFILEMNNETNQIMGIGLIKNIEKMARDEYVNFHRPSTNHIKEWYNTNKQYKAARRFIIHTEKNQGYNNFIYKGSYRIDASEFDLKEKRFFYVLEKLVFKGGGHLKRGHGITIIPEWIKNNTVINFIREFKNMFQRRKT